MCHSYICTVYDLEPKKVTGTAKYIGKVDSEYVDNRIYVGVKLDEPGESTVCSCININFIYVSMCIYIHMLANIP